MALGFKSFDEKVGAGAASSNAGAALPVELPADQQRYGPLTPNPSEFVSDHSAEGAPWLPAARSIPQDAPQGPLWSADHDGPSIPFDASAGKSAHSSGPATDAHDGTAGKNAYGPLNIGRPFLAVQNRMRHLATNVYDPQGRIVNPVDAPSAPTQMWNSQHDTEPRWIGFDVAPLFSNVGTGPRFSGNNPGYLGVNDSQPDMAQRQFGSVAAQMPDDPYVAQSASADTGAPDYDWSY